MKDVYISTYTGKRFYPFDPQIDHVDIIDIAHSLSNINRWIGHTNRPYNVAEHSIHVAWLIKEQGGNTRDQLWGLLHDASEAYFGDIASPIKHSFSELVKFEHNIQQVIAKKFNLPWPMPEIVHRADKKSLLIEANNLFLVRPKWAPEISDKLLSISDPYTEYLKYFTLLSGVSIGPADTECGIVDRANGTAENQRSADPGMMGRPTMPDIRPDTGRNAEKRL